MSKSSPKKKRRVAVLNDSEPEEVFRKMFQEADKKIRPELRNKPRRRKKKGDSDAAKT